MFRKIVSALAISETEIVAWFADGDVRLLEIEDYAGYQPVTVGGLPEVVVQAEGYGITISDDLDISSNDFFGKSVRIDMVQPESARVIADVVQARHAARISQAKLAMAAGVKQPVVARLETRVNSPRLDTLLKVLMPLGKTLKICDLSGGPAPVSFDLVDDGDAPSDAVEKR